MNYENEKNSFFIETGTAQSLYQYELNSGTVFQFPATAIVFSFSKT